MKTNDYIAATAVIQNLGKLAISYYFWDVIQLKLNIFVNNNISQAIRRFDNLSSGETASFSVLPKLPVAILFSSSSRKRWRVLIRAIDRLFIKMTISRLSFFNSDVRILMSRITFPRYTILALDGLLDELLMLYLNSFEYNSTKWPRNLRLYERATAWLATEVGTEL